MFPVYDIDSLVLPTVKLQACRAADGIVARQPGYMYYFKDACLCAMWYKKRQEAHMYYAQR